MKIWVLTMLPVWVLGHPTQETCGGSSVGKSSCLPPRLGFLSVGKSENVKESPLQLNGKFKFPTLFSFRERKGFYTVLKLKQGQIGEDPGNKMKFPFVHFCFHHLSGKIKIFLKCDV
jgi:hypothetical protein